MTPDEFKDIRMLLGLTQAELARVLGYAHRNGVAILENAASGRRASAQVERLMRAYEAGYRPADWPKLEIA
jgi:transcriptional regulator with XRE-family HTH domain